MQAQQYQQTSACTRRPTCPQVTAYLLVLALLLTFLVALLPKLPARATVAFGLLQGATFLVLGVSAWRTSLVDPVDPVLVAYRKGLKDEVKDVLKECLFCERCQSYVRSTSRHCKICGRCVDRFDHHCLWINHCIGRQNYTSFLVMVASAALFCWLFVAGLSLLWNQQNWRDYPGLMAWMWVCFAAALLFSLLLTLLFLLHLYLLRKGLTTFEFITNKNSPDTAPRNKKAKANQTEETFQEETFQEEEHQPGSSVNRDKVTTGRKDQREGAESEEPSSMSRREQAPRNNKVAPLDPEPQQAAQQIGGRGGKVLGRSWSLKFLGGHSIETVPFESALSQTRPVSGLQPVASENTLEHL